MCFETWFVIACTFTWFLRWFHLERHEKSDKYNFFSWYGFHKRKFQQISGFYLVLDAFVVSWLVISWFFTATPAGIFIFTLKFLRWRSFHDAQNLNSMAKPICTSLNIDVCLFWYVFFWVSPSMHRALYWVYLIRDWVHTYPQLDHLFHMYSYVFA